MGSRGPIPKGTRSRARDEVKPTVLAVSGRPKPPTLPKGYSPATAAWFKTWATSPQAAEFASTDWQRLLMLAPLVEAYNAKPDRFLMAEIRATEARLGATVEDRRRLHMKIEQPPPEVRSIERRYDHIEPEAS